MSIDTLIPPQAAPALHELDRGMALKKCWRCGCMKDALNQAARAFADAEEAEIRGLLPTIAGYRERMQSIVYDCLGCKKCWGADATIQLANQFCNTAHSLTNEHVSFEALTISLLRGKRPHRILEKKPKSDRRIRAARRRGRP